MTDEGARSERDMEEEIERLEEDIEHAREAEEEMHRLSGDDGDDIAGDWRETHDAAGGEDPEGAQGG